MNSSRSRLAAVVYFLVAAPIALVVLSALPQHAAPQHPANEIVLGIDPAQSKVRWSLGSTVHTVHGSFAFKKGNLQLDMSTGKARGEIIVDATRKCTKRFSKAVSTRKSFFDLTAWKGKLRRGEFLRFRYTAFLTCMAVNTS